MIIKSFSHSIIMVLLLVLSNQSFAQWNTYFDLITERDSFPDIGEMSFINPQTGLATSELPPILGNQNFRGGTLILTVDSGRTWSTQIVEDSIAFTDVKYLDTNLIIATGAEAFGDTTLAKQGAIGRSLDGGLTWSVNYFPMRLSNIAVLNDSTIMVAANDARNPNQYWNFMISSNYGVSWTVLPSNYPNEGITDLLFMNDSIGFASSVTGRILKTVNQGVSWDSLPLSWSVRTNIENLSSPDSINLFFNASSVSYDVYHSSDLGLTWTQKSQIQIPMFLYKAEFVTDSIGFYFGTHHIFKTYNQGTSWIYTVVNGTSHIPFCTSIQFFDDNLIYLGGNYAFLRTSNGADSTLLTGIEATSYGVELTVYPNPTTGLITVESEAEIESVELFDLSGLRYYSATAESPSLTNSRYTSTNLSSFDEPVKTLDVTHLKPGVYFLKVRLASGEVVTKKLIKT